MSVSEIGLVFGIYFAGMSVSSLMFGSLMGRPLRGVPGPKFFYITGMLVRACADLLFALLPFSPSGRAFLVLTFILRLVESIGASAFMIGMYVIIAHEFKPKDIPPVFGVITTANGLGLMSGPPIGGALYEFGGFSLPFIVLGGSMILVAAISYFVIPPISDNKHEQPSESIPEGSRTTSWMWSLLHLPSVSLNMICATLVYGPICFVEISLEQHLSQFLLSPALVGLVFTALTGSYAISSACLGLINRSHFHPSAQLVFGCLVYIISFMTLGPTPVFKMKGTLWSICLSLCGVGLAASSINIVVFKDSLDTAKRSGYSDNFSTFGLVSGLYQFFHTMGGFLGPTVFSEVAQQTGSFPLACSYYATLISGILLLIFGYQMIRRRNKLKSLVSWGSEVKGDIERVPLLGNTAVPSPIFK